jgi:hypothetical protein
MIGGFKLLYKETKNYMAENKFCGSAPGTASSANFPSTLDTISIDCNRILDSCRDKDLFDEARVFLSGFGNELIDKTNNLRVKSATVVWTSLCVEPIQFNRGFYQIDVKFHVKLVIECCICPGKCEEFEGIAVCEKKVILYGSEGNVNIFKSDPNSAANFCSTPCSEVYTNNLPTAVCEVIDPIVLDLKVKTDLKCGCNCCSNADDIPDHISTCINGNLVDTYDDNAKKLFVTLGFFSIIRIERPGQFLIKATEYSVPDKECIVTDEEDPCSLFKRMSFPTNEFTIPSYQQIAETTPITLATFDTGIVSGRKHCT